MPETTTGGACSPELLLETKENGWKPSVWVGSQSGKLSCDVLSVSVLSFHRTLTGVPADRQKLMANRKLLKNIEDLQALALAGKGVKITMLGTAEGGELKQPESKTVFLEDLSPAEQARLLREKNFEPLPPVSEDAQPFLIVTSHVAAFRLTRRRQL